MTIKFDPNGNLPKDITLTLTEFISQFGYNPKRRKLIQNLLEIAAEFAEFGCEAMHVNGSFVTSKRLPGDIDVAFDITEVDYVPAKQKYPAFFSDEGRRTIKSSHKLDVFIFGGYNDDILYVFGHDRQKNKKGIVKILLKDLLRYDKE